MTIEAKETLGETPTGSSRLARDRRPRKVTFADLVLAHNLRQKRVYDAAVSDNSSFALALVGAADRAYQRIRLGQSNVRFEMDDALNEKLAVAEEAVADSRYSSRNACTAGPGASALLRRRG